VAVQGGLLALDGAQHGKDHPGTGQSWTQERAGEFSSIHRVLSPFDFKVNDPRFNKNRFLM
jgi:hypothetical protein